ncbi:hypothetical protein CNMCM8980_007831 [Aspergillus fumigatiaffinis]|nr:hypothetical protein CNMCM6457_006853 [Aspergillus fumigatiaffinis]KAF4247151.1 hypothetical protein CNMCM8980_007831 [Aspergillus fumigatiaffinis]
MKHPTDSPPARPRLRSLVVSAIVAALLTMPCLSVLLVITLLHPAVKATDLTSHVNLFTGTQNGGNNFPGVARPFGMVKLGPDLLNPGTDAYSGYLPTGAFSGFSMMHEQGTGGAPKRWRGPAPTRLRWDTTALTRRTA